MKKILNIAIIIAAIIIISGIGGICFAVVNMAGVSTDPSYSKETAQVVLTACRSHLLQGIKQILIGGCMILVCSFFKKRK